MTDPTDDDAQDERDVDTDAGTLFEPETLSLFEDFDPIPRTPKAKPKVDDSDGAPADALGGAPTSGADPDESAGHESDSATADAGERLAAGNTDDAPDTGNLGLFDDLDGAPEETADHPNTASAPGNVEASEDTVPERLAERVTSPEPGTGSADAGKETIDAIGGQTASAPNETDRGENETGDGVDSDTVLSDTVLSDTVLSDTVLSDAVLADEPEADAARDSDGVQDLVATPAGVGEQDGPPTPSSAQRVHGEGSPRSEPASSEPPAMAADAANSAWTAVVGQTNAVARLQRALLQPVHAYLFVGPSGVGKQVAARAFAAQLLSGTDDVDNRDVGLVMRGEHPDVTEVVRSGASISADQAREIVRTAALTPVEGSRKVMILNEFHLLRPEGAAILLKTIEEPPPSTTILVLADFVPNDLITISSRCARIDFRSLTDDEITAALIGDGVAADQAELVAQAAAGSIERARVLVSDPDLAARRAAFAAVPGQLDGAGSTAYRLVDELLAQVDAAAGAIQTRHEAEVAELDERIKQYGSRGSGKKQLEERHKRELRRHRTDELLAGLAVIAGQYRDALAAGSMRRIEDGVAAVERIYAAMESFEYNPNESLLLLSLLWSLPPLAGHGLTPASV